MARSRPKRRQRGRAGDHPERSDEQLSRDDLSQLDEGSLWGLGVQRLRTLSVKWLADLKAAHEHLDQNSYNSLRPPSREAPLSAQTVCQRSFAERLWTLGYEKGAEFDAEDAIRDYILFLRLVSELVAPASFGVRHRYLEKPVAIKAIFRRHVRDNQFYQRFLLEAILMARLGPPNIVGTHEFYAVGGN